MSTNRPLIKLTSADTGERPFICKEPSCRRRFSVQSNLKRHAKVHQAGGAGAEGHGVAGVGAGSRNNVHPPPAGQHLSGAEKRIDEWDPEEDDLDEDELEEEDE